MELENPTVTTVPRYRLPPLELLRENARIFGGHIDMWVRCDRCNRRIEAPVSRIWLLGMSEVRDRYPVPAASFIRSREGERGMTTIRASPKLCTGYSDGSCFASRNFEYVRTWKAFKSLPGSYKTDREWLSLRYPPTEGYSAHPGWQDMLKNAAMSATYLTPPYTRYLSWRFAWHLFWHHGGMRHQSAPLERMWGNVAADVLLWQFGLLQDRDVEALYCTSVGSLVGLLACRWDYGIAVLEMFYAIRQDLNKHGFSSLKAAVQRADTAMRWYIKAIREDDEEQRYQRMLLNSRFLVLSDMLRAYATEEQCRFFAMLYCKPPQIPREAFGLVSKYQFDEESDEESGEVEGERADEAIKWLMHHIAEHEAIHGTFVPQGAEARDDLTMSHLYAFKSCYGNEFIEELTESVQER
ncbi:hypothetical protein LX36DRAFT_663781 [Colletotrichum falcatum]|nr:hypothetical protein LX36DRAFT_663781 [Colletotrichum falcatum]